MKTVKERLDTIDEYSSLAFRLINELWVDKHEGLVLDQDTLTAEQLSIRSKITDTRIAILTISNEIEMIKIRLGLDR